MRELVEQRGAKLLFLPSFSPIKKASSKAKALLRRAEARTKGALAEVISRALNAITSEDVRG